MDKIAVVMATDDNQAFALANVIIGLKRYNENLIEKNIYIKILSIRTKNQYITYGQMR